MLLLDLDVRFTYTVLVHPFLLWQWQVPQGQLRPIQTLLLFPASYAQEPTRTVAYVATRIVQCTEEDCLPDLTQYVQQQQRPWLNQIHPLPSTARTINAAASFCHFQGGHARASLNAVKVFRSLPANLGRWQSIFPRLVFFPRNPRVILRGKGSIFTAPESIYLSHSRHFNDGTSYAYHEIAARILQRYIRPRASDRVSPIRQIVKTVFIASAQMDIFAC